jgi:hypothetical protein
MPQQRVLNQQRPEGSDGLTDQKYSYLFLPAGHLVTGRQAI